MNKVRVLVANRPRLMRELVLATLSDQPDIEVIGEIQNDAEVLQVAAESNPDFVIVALDQVDRRPAICDELLALHPQMRILALAPERNRGMCVWAVIDIHSSTVESSEEGILNALRTKVQLVS